MAKRRTKPPGKENWTWQEIDAGRKMGRGQRRSARNWAALAKGVGIAPRADGTRPTFGENPGGWLAYLGLGALLIVMLIIAVLGGKR